MRALPRALLAFHARTWIAELVRRGLLWLCLATTALSLWTAICILWTLPRDWWLAAVMAAASILPAFLLWPIDRPTFLAPLRAFDVDSVVESWLEAGPAARCLLEIPLRRLEPGLAKSRRGAVSYTRGLGRPALAAALSLLMLQALSMALLAKPTVVWQGPDQRAASGIRLSPGEQNAPNAGRKQPPEMAILQPPSSATTTAEEARQARAANEGEDAFNLGHGPGLELPGSEGGAAVPDTAPSAASDELGAPLPATEDSSAASGRPDPKAGAAPQSSAQAQGGKGITGFEGNGASNVPSPLVDYRSRLVKILSASEAGNRRASGDLSTKSFDELQRRWFDSFAIGTGIGPREDSWTSLLRRRWAELLSAGKEGR